jgi:hypothetical protein
MTNEEAMRICTDIGVHEGGMENWVMDNAWVKFAERVAAHTLMNIDPSKFIGGYQEGFEAGVAKESEDCIQNVLQQHEGFGTEHQGVEYVKQRIVEAIRARGKA